LSELNAGLVVYPQNAPTTKSLMNQYSLEVTLLFQKTTLQVLHLNEPKALSLGDAPGCDFFIAGLPKTPLVTLTEQGEAFCFLRGAAGYLSDETKRQQLSSVTNTSKDGLCAVLIAPRTRYVLQLGALELQLQRVEQAMPIKDEASKDRNIWSYTAASTLFHSLLLLLLFQVSPEERSLDLALLQSNNLLVSFQTQPTEEKPEEIPNWRSEKMRSGLLGEREGRMHNGPSGAMGKKHAKQQQGLYQVQGLSQDPHLARHQAEALAQQAGIIALIKGGAGVASPFASLFGKETMVGTDPKDILGGLLGERTAEAGGGYGLGLRGTGMGGNYKGEGTLGAGSFGLSGAGAGGSCDETTCTGVGLGFGSGMGSGREIKKEKTHTASAPEAIEGKSTSSCPQCLDKDVIRRVIRRAMPGIKYCYEQGLLQNKNLAGKVSIHFVIANNGAVVSATPKAGISATVDQCVARKISQLSFPTPGGLVEVDYPFLFQSTK
jgi:hypothetical protein